MLLGWPVGDCALVAVACVCVCVCVCVFVCGKSVRMECASSSLDNNTASAMEGMDCDPETEAVEERECYQGEADMRRFPVRTGDLNSFVRQGSLWDPPPSPHLSVSTHLAAASFSVHVCM